MPTPNRIWDLIGAIAGPVDGADFRARFHAQERGWGQSFGWPIQLLAALAWSVAAAGPIGAAEILPFVVVGCAALRLHATWRLARPVLTSRMVVLWLLLAAWMAASLLWSPDPKKGFQELANGRWLWCVAGVVPVIHRRSWLIAALVVGLLLGNCCQLLEAIGLRTGASWLVWPHPPNPLEHARISGWWHHPVMGGIVLVGALGLHLPPAVFGSGWRRIMGVLGAALSVAGMIATGARGAWVAACALVCFTLVVAFVRMPREKGLRVLAGAAAIALVLGGAAWAWRGDAVGARLSSAVSEVRRALDDKDYASDTGARVRFAIWAGQMIAERPVLGHGAGSYEWWTRNQGAEQSTEPGRRRFAPQAHNTALHAWATLGLPGVLLFAAIITVGVCGGLVVARAVAPPVGDWMGTYAAGPSWALIGLSFVGMFDTIYVNVQPAAFATALLCLCLPFAPGVTKFDPRAIR